VRPKSQAEAAILVASSSAYIAAATALLEAEVPALIESVLSGDVSILEAADASVRKRARLISAYRGADRGDRMALGKVVGIDRLFDEAIMPSL
jgi:hypothetical protein